MMLGLLRMTTAETKAGVAGQEMGLAIGRMVNLFYQKNTANNFYIQLIAELKRQKKYVEGV